MIADRNDTPAPGATGNTSPVALPSSPEMRRWVDRTHQERESLKARAERVREKFEPIRRELAGIERSIKVLDHFLAQITVEETATNGAGPGRSGKRGPSPLNGQWSRSHAACLLCGKTDQRHKAQGYCSRCYDRRGRLVAAEEAAP